MSDYLTKPIKGKDLYQMLQNWLSHSHNECTHDMPEKENHPESAIDPEALVSIKALQADYGDELLTQVIKTYLDNSNKLLQSLEQAWGTGDSKTIRMVSHTLKSSSSQVGAYSLAELCRAVENEARNQNYDKTGQALKAIQKQFDQTCTALKSYLDSSAANTGSN